MKKEDVAGLIIYMLIFAVAVVYGLAVLQPHFSESTFKSGIIYALFILGALVSGIILSAIFEEIGHVLGAKVGGYKILSVSVLGLTFYKEDKKFRFKFASFNGLTGETKVLPKSETSNPNPYLLMGTLFTSIVSAGALVAFYLLMPNKGMLKDWSYFFLTLGGVSLICLVYNLLPIKLESMNDGYRLAMVSNPKNKEAFNELLRVEYEISQGNTDVEIKTFTELTNFTAELNMNKVYILLDKKEYKEAIELIDLVINNKENVSARVYLRAIAMKINLLALAKEEDAFNSFVASVSDMDTRRDIFDDGAFVSIRAYLLLSGIVDSSKSECLLVLEKVPHAYKATPKNRRMSETVLFNETLDLLLEKHPKWEELNKYRFTVE